MDKTIDRIITLKNWLEFILIILIPYRGYLVFADGQGTYYIVRQIIHLIGWIMLYIFVSNYNPLWKIQESFQKKYATKMKKISLAATVVLAVKLFILVTYYILSVTPDLWSVVNISTEILAWLFIMGVFAYSYNYWKHQLLELRDIM